MKQKRGMSKLGWLVIALIVIGVAVGLYFWLGGGSGIPSPPALPD